MVKIFIKSIFFFVVVLPIISLPILVILLLRKLVSIAAKIFKRDELEQMLTATSTGFDDAPTFSRSALTIVTIFEINNGKINITDLRKVFEENILHAKRRNGSRLRYPELQCKLVEWWGYYFWGRCDSFNIEDRIQYLAESEFSKLDFSCPENWNKLLNYSLQERLWDKENPLWELLVVENVVTERGVGKSLVISRFSHVLCDGGSVLEIAVRLFGLGLISKDMTPRLPPKSGLMTQYCSSILAFFKFPYQMIRAKENVHSNLTRVPPLNNESKCENPAVFSRTVNSPSIQEFKRIKDAYKVDFLSLLLTGVAAGIRNTYEQGGHPIHDDIKVALVLPVPNHPHKLRNHLAIGMILLPIGEADSVKRLKLVGERIRLLRSSSAPIFGMMFVYPLFCSLPVPILRRLWKHQGLQAPVMVNNAFSQPEKLYWNGDEGLIIFGGVNITRNGNRGYAYDNRFYSHDGKGYFGVSGFQEYFSNAEDQPSQYLNACMAEWRKLADLMEMEQLEICITDK